MNRTLTLVPIKTEKSFRLANSGIYTFSVQYLATKPEIVSAFKDIYGVDVIKLSSLVKTGKTKTNWTNRTKTVRPTLRKVYVRLVKDQKLELFK